MGSTAFSGIGYNNRQRQRKEKTDGPLCHGNSKCIYYINRRRKGIYSVPVLFFPNPQALSPGFSLV